jgi:hypothetical protein
MSQSPLPPSSKLTRRRIFAGVGTAGALAAVAAALPLAPTRPQVAAQPKPAADPSGGYQLTEHVRRYYQTAKV